MREPVVEPVVRDLFLPGAVGAHAPNLHETRARGVEIDPLAVGRELGSVVEARRVGETDLLAAAVGRDLVDVILVRAVGGLLGYVTSSSDPNNIKNCYSTGKVIYSGGTNPTDKGFVGSAVYPGNVYSDNFFDKDSSAQTSASKLEPSAATGKTTTEMKTLATFTDTTTTGLTTAWDFVGNPNDDKANNEYWDLDPNKKINKGYPYLLWNSCNIDIHWTEENPGKAVEQWTSRDIWVQDTKPTSTTKAPLKNTAFQAGKSYYICARFRNQGPESARAVRTDFYIAAEVGDMIIDLNMDGVYESGTKDNVGSFKLINSSPTSSTSQP